MSHEVELPVVRLDPGLALPRYAHPGDAGLDLHAREPVTLQPGERALVPTGISIELPPGTAGFVHPRSGLAHRHGVTVVNAPGTVDVGYRGEIFVNLLNTDRAQPVHLERGDRIAQLVVQPVLTAVVREVTSTSTTERGTTGHGASGLAPHPAP